MLSTDTKRLEDAYGVFNREYFNGELPMVMITIQSSLKAYGHCTTKKIWASGSDRYYELNLSAEYLSRPIENVLATLVHEMVHIYCMETGIKDTSITGDIIISGLRQRRKCVALKSLMLQRLAGA